MALSRLLEAFCITNLISLEVFFFIRRKGLQAGLIYRVTHIRTRTREKHFTVLSTATKKILCEHQHLRLGRLDLQDCILYVQKVLSVFPYINGQDFSDIMYWTIYQIYSISMYKNKAHNVQIRIFSISKSIKQFINKKKITFLGGYKCPCVA